MQSVEGDGKRHSMVWKRRRAVSASARTARRPEPGPNSTAYPALAPAIPHAPHDLHPGSRPACRLDPRAAGSRARGAGSYHASAARSIPGILGPWAVSDPKAGVHLLPLRGHLVGP